MKIQTLSIVAGSTECNARCPFCVSKMTCSNGVKKDYQNVNWHNFHKACRLAQVSGVTTVMITGKGEPTIFPGQVGTFLNELKKYDFPLVEMQTNGLLFSKKNSMGLVLDHHAKSWYKAGLGMIAISVVHYIDKMNNKIYNPYETEYPNLSNTIKYLHEIGFSVRLSCVMVKGYIDSIESIMGMIEFAQNNKVEQLTFTPVNKTTAKKNDAYWEWADDHTLKTDKMNEIRNFFDGRREGVAVLMRLIHGATVCDVNGQNVCLSECLTTKNNDELRNLIFFPDGHLRYDWQYNGAILL
jgi:molybdenum cofactor biosynthesis enzyme MoaA